MKGNWPVSIEVSKAEEINDDLRAWGYTSRGEFVLAAHKREKEEREKPAKGGRKL